MKLAVLPGDGIGPEIVAEAMKVIDYLRSDSSLDVETEHGLIGGASYDAHGEPLTKETLEKAKTADAVLLGAVGGHKWESLPIAVRPEKGLLGLRAGMGLFANLRPAILYPQLADASSLKPEVVAGLDIMIVRELTGGIYFGRKSRDADRAVDECAYSVGEVERITRVAGTIAADNNGVGVIGVARSAERSISLPH